MLRQRAAAVPALVLVACALLVASCSSKSPADGNRVLVIGDSLLQESTAAVDSTLRAAGWDPAVEGVGGTRIQHWVDRIDGLVATVQPDVAVVALGTNNCTDDSGCRDLTPHIERILRALDGTDAVLWLNVQQDPSYPAERDFVNFEIERAVARWPDVWLVDLAAAFDGHPELRKADGLHFNEAGQLELGRLIADELEPFSPGG